MYKRKVVKNADSVKKKEKVLIVYSCLQDNAFLQQNIVIICQFVEHLCDNYDVTILTSRATLKLIVPSCVKVIVCGVNEKSISMALRTEKIGKIIPIGCGLKLISSVCSKCKVYNFFDSFLSAKKSKRHFKKLAKKAGFCVKKIPVSAKKMMNSICFTLIKDCFNNQIVLDAFNVSVINGKKVFRTNIAISAMVQRKIRQVIDNFGNLLSTKKYPYIVKLFVGNDDNIYFDNICYGLSDEVLFSLQRQMINIVKIMFDIDQKKHLFFHYNRSVSALSYDYNNSFFVNFTNEQNDENFNSLDTCFVDNYKIGILESAKHSKHLSFFDCTNELKYLHTDTFKTYGEFIIVSLGNEFINDINSQLFFCKMCNSLSKKTEKKILLLTRTWLPIFQLLKNCHIVIGDFMNETNFKLILKKYSVKTAYISFCAENSKLSGFLQKFGIKVYCQKTDVDKFLFGDSEALVDFCNKIGCLCQYERFDSSEKIMYFSCIVDGHKNIAFPTITSVKFYGLVNANCYFYPALLIDYDVCDRIKKIAYDIIQENNSFGFLTVSFVYKNGDVYVHDICVNNAIFSLFFYVDRIQVLYDLLLQGMCGKAIDVAVRQNATEELPQFYQKICFEHVDRQIVELDGTTKKKVFLRYIKLFQDKGA